MKTLESISNFQNDYFTHIYQASTKTHQLGIGSFISFDSKKMIVELKQDSYNEVYKSTWKVKSLEKACNLLQRAARDFKNYDNKRSYPYLATMEKNYKNYFTKESDLTIDFE